MRQLPDARRSKGNSDFALGPVVFDALHDQPDQAGNFLRLEAGPMVVNLLPRLGDFVHTPLCTLAVEFLGKRFPQQVSVVA